MARRKRRPEPDPVLARPPQWLLFGSVGLVILLVGPPILALVNGQGTAAMLALALWPVALLAVIWRSRLVVDRDGVDVTFLGTRHVDWADVEALVASSSGIRGPYLRIRGERPIPLNPMWRADGKAVPVAVEPWARRKRVRVEGAVAAGTASRARTLTIVVLVALGALVGLIVARLTV